SGTDAFRPLAVFFTAVVLALAFHMFVFLPLVLKYIARVNPILHFKAMMPALLTAFSTSSSSATLPLTLDCVERRAGVSNRVSGFTLPLGATVNMDGTALYECVAAMFIAQAYGLELSLVTQFTIVLIALLTSIGVAGIPSASLVAITIILGTIGLPLEAIGLILVVDRVLDMCRTSVNVFSDSCAAVTIARLEGEDDVLREKS
ncbi:MAG: dicarboxylate/amino acid:cation symporter, partial [Gammaproteobacteria bacterium]|nr:dicarboxylate/amino acid:cation symporter [Gammaproteobacteria bacterium]